MTGHVTGGRLKTPADADAESLQAKWVSDLGELSLRANDVLTLVERGRQYQLRRQDEPWHMPQVRYDRKQGCSPYSEIEALLYNLTRFIYSQRPKA